MRWSADRRVLECFLDVQVMGAIVMHQGHIAEDSTGEEKRWLPCHLSNALTGEGAILVTTNEYLAKRDAEREMGQVYEFLGLSIGVPLHQMEDLEASDNVRFVSIIYTTNSGLGLMQLII